MDDVMVKALLVFIGVLALFMVSCIGYELIPHSKHDNTLTYCDQWGRNTEINIPNDAYFEGYRWDGADLIMTFGEG